MSSQNLDVTYVAHLARIALSEEEAVMFQAQLGRVLEYVEQLRAIDVSHVEPMAHATPVHNVFRQDESEVGLSKTDALANAPRTTNGLFTVTKVVE